ncbi:sensor histidine kinase [Microbispora triticiradicis]|uniref:Sensor histidine kinase n=2 Tax=Microbispora TaxID=2005 RepID=A0ABY3M0B6_9ACTN|nr:MULTISPECIES: sensor histidine kinase [Microbispora]TLP60739.1 sensor histidine kinase [Microbispora fusca]TYB62039.1 sensor histidine kinase [Microbispora tritici]
MTTERDTWLDPLRGGERGPDAKGMFIWVLLTAGPVWDIAHGRSHPLWLAWPAAAAAAGLYLLTTHYAFADRRRALPSLGLLAAVVLTAATGFGDNWLYLVIMLATATGIAVRGRILPLLLFAECAAALLLAVRGGAGLTDAAPLVWGTFTAGLIPAMIVALWAAIDELKATREELARTAVTEERLRFSRDLHDLLGHTLSVMVVKAEAVRRLTQVDAEAAGTQAADIERIGRQALAEVRAAVTGYRGRGLAAELDAARTVLADAGIGAVVRTCPVRAAPEIDALLGWAVREGVTNVVRHSGAAACDITLREIDPVEGDGRLLLEIRDDGPARGKAPGHGNGLTGLRERVRAVGGSLEIATPTDGGFLLGVSVPYAKAVLYDKEEQA